jgi:hypothetical protein
MYMRKNMSYFLCFVYMQVAIFLFQTTGCQKKNSMMDKEYTNSIGVHFVRIEPGSGPRIHGDWDEQPVHKVTISNPFYISVSEVTIKQYQQFQSDYAGIEKFDPYVSGVNWYEANAFCDWLSEKEGRPYRLPTEAEWEYACRAGTESLFSSGDTLRDTEKPNAWGVKNMHGEVVEWCLDWHGRYPYEDQIDPVGPAKGLVKVVRGGGFDIQNPYYWRSANRAGFAPDFPPSAMRKLNVREAIVQAETDKKSVPYRPKGFETPNEWMYAPNERVVLNNQGNHHIGIRVVMAEMPETKPNTPEVPFVKQCVRQEVNFTSLGPDPEKPYFRKRRLLTIPPESIPIDQVKSIGSTGLHPALLRHNHNPCLVVCPNGDLLAVYYTAYGESSPDVALIASRLRLGTDQWDMPTLLLDFPDVNDHGPLLWNDNGTIQLIWGHNQLPFGFPFQWTSSADNGAKWSAVKFPIFESTVGPHSAQPINTAFRDAAGTIYISSDGIGSTSVLWTSHNEGKTWIDPGGRTFGRHTSFVLLKDGRILGMGGKNSNIDGYMPISISDDGGKTWSVSKTPFASLGSNQQPTIIRLASGRLFFAGDFQRTDGYQPPSIKQRGVGVALSDDEGKTWHIKKLDGAQGHESVGDRTRMKGATLGYSVSQQASNGIIHLLSTQNTPCLHFAFNEAYILQSPDLSGKNLLDPDYADMEINQIEAYQETYPDGSKKVTGKGCVGDNGLYLLHGTETWYYPNGQKQWEARYDKGQKLGEETLWTAEGKKIWSWDHRKDGTSVWTHWWPNGKKKYESTWKNKETVSVVTSWDPSGKIISQNSFHAVEKGL